MKYAPDVSRYIEGIFLECSIMFVDYAQFHLFIFVYSFIYFYLFTYLYIYIFFLTIYMSICLSIYLSISTSLYLYLFIYLFIHSFIHFLFEHNVIIKCNYCSWSMFECYFQRIFSYFSRIRRNLSIHMARFSASESLRAYTNIHKNSPLFASS